MSGKDFENEERVIHSSRFMDREILKQHRSVVKLVDKLSNELTLSAVQLMKKAKSNHDELEDYYIKAMDFENLKKFTCDFAQKMLLY